MRKGGQLIHLHFCPLRRLKRDESVERRVGGLVVHCNERAKRERATCSQGVAGGINDAALCFLRIRLWQAQACRLLHLELEDVQECIEGGGSLLGNLDVRTLHQETTMSLPIAPLGFHCEFPLLFMLQEWFVFRKSLLHWGGR